MEITLVHPILQVADPDRRVFLRPLDRRRQPITRHWIRIESRQVMLVGGHHDHRVLHRHPLRRRRRRLLLRLRVIRSGRRLHCARDYHPNLRPKKHRRRGGGEFRPPAAAAMAREAGEERGWTQLTGEGLVV